MKNTIIVIIMLITFGVSGQNNKMSKVEELIEVTQTDAMVPYVINTLIKQFKGKNPNIPESYWEEIKKEVDYNTFMAKTKKIYADNYTIEELDDLIATHKSGDLESYKKKNEKIKTQIYQIGKEFGVQVVQHITNKVKAYKG